MGEWSKLVLVAATDYQTNRHSPLLINFSEVIKGS